MVTEQIVSKTGDITANTCTKTEVIVIIKAYFLNTPELVRRQRFGVSRLEMMMMLTWKRFYGNFTEMTRFG